MTHKFLWAALVAVLGTLVGYQQPLAAAAEPDAATTSSDAMNDVAHPTPANTTNSEHHTGQQSYNQQNGQQSNWQDRDQQQNSPDNDRQSRQDRERDQTNNRSDSQSQHDSREARQKRDWHSDIEFGQQRQGGLEITSVEQGTPFYRGGLRDGDVILSYNGRQIQNRDDFGRWVDYRAGQRIPVIIWRDGRRQTVYINYQGDRNNQGDRSQWDSDQSYAQSSNSSQGYLGVRFDERARGRVVISNVASGSPADQAGLKPGDELTALNGRQVQSARDVTRIVGSMQPGDRLDIEFSRRVENHTQAVLEGRPGNFARAEYQGSYEQTRGSQYDNGIEQSSYNEESTTSAPDDYYNGQRTMQRNSSERRGGLGILQRWRD